MTFHTTEEVAMIVGCSARHLHVAAVKDHGCSLKEFMGRFKGMGIMSLRRRQFQLAMEGNSTMLRWLGIQHLGQSPKVTLLHKVPTTAEQTPSEPQNPDPDGFEIDGLTDMDQNVDDIDQTLAHTPTTGNDKTHALTHQHNKSDNDGSVVDAEIVNDED